MNTLTFYSYKGGVGRTLALANVARYLALLGKRVVCADFDFEAPGLHYKFDIGVDQLAGGTLDLVAAVVDGAARVPDIADLAVPVELGGGPGSITLLAAGRAPSPEYWRTLGAMDWHRLFFAREAGDTPVGVELFLDLRERIEAALTPDYLLIDARTGITEVGGVALSLLADAVVCIAAHNKENLDGARAVLRSVKAAPGLVEGRVVRLLPVLSRIPATLDPAEEAQLVERVRTFLNEAAEPAAAQLAIDRVFLLHSEPRLQVYESLKVPEAGAVEESTLLRDYLELFRALIPREHVVEGIAPLLERARMRAFEDADTAQGELESLAMLYPTPQTALALLQLYVLRNLSGDRVLVAARSLFEITGNAAEPLLLTAIRQHHASIPDDDPAILDMARAVWAAQARSDTRLARQLLERHRGAGSIDGITQIVQFGLHDSSRKDPELAAAAVQALRAVGDCEGAAELAAELQEAVGLEGPFLAARVEAVAALGEPDVAEKLVDELEAVRRRVPQAAWFKLMVASGRGAEFLRSAAEPQRDLLMRIMQKGPDRDLAVGLADSMVDLNRQERELLYDMIRVVSDSGFAGFVSRLVRRRSLPGS